MNFVSGLPVAAIALRVDLVRQEELDPLRPDLLRLAHRHPHVGVQEVGALHAFLDRVREGDAGARLGGHRPALLDELVVRPQIARGDEADVHAQRRAALEQGIAHVVPGVAQIGVGDLLDRLGAVLLHRQHVREDLRRVPLVGQAVVDGHAGVIGQDLDQLLVEAAVLDPVVDPAEHARCVLDRLLVPDLRPAGIEVRHVRALVVRGDLERTAGPGGGLLEDEADLLLPEPLDLCARLLLRLELGRQIEQVVDLRRAEIGEVEEVPALEVHGCLGQRHRDPLWCAVLAA